MDYLSWNNSIGARFFTPEAKDRRVYLYVTADLIREIGKPSGAGMPDFLVAVKRGPEWVSHGNVCERAEKISALRVGGGANCNTRRTLLIWALFAFAAGLRGGLCRGTLIIPGCASCSGARRLRQAHITGIPQ